MDDFSEFQNAKMPPEVLLGCLGLLWDPLGRQLGPLEALLGPPKRVLGRSGEALGPFVDAPDSAGPPNS